ncbi:CAP domain-containing protein [Terrabacter sp. MAHUQ-38]|uniref:CAP domain-containing protein n=1 Tax=unclassified Terrabacter TaxID=2630222 RepID=UPI00165DB92D|nr:CAP domain-containing protein [Terrabacter sp. MAHUQ-38]MBC9820901.1 CAP domain-containing protein [Terrabacter sp. MAHUQ-38]
MGRHTDPAVIGSRRAAVLTVTASALLVAGGIAVLRSAGDARIGPTQPATPSMTPSVTLSSDVSEPGRTSTTSPTTPPATTTRSAAITTPPTGPSPRATVTVASGPTGTPSASLAPTAPAKPAPPPRAGVSRQVVALVNVERARAGCGPVASDPALTRAAQRHSDDMAARGYFSHTGPDGTTFADRIRAAGYAGDAIAENIAAGQTTAKAVMKSWMGSADHRADILGCTYRDLGVGYATGGTYGTYWTLALGG